MSLLLSFDAPEDVRDLLRYSLRLESEDRRALVALLEEAGVHPERYTSDRELVEQAADVLEKRQVKYHAGTVPASPEMVERWTGPVLHGFGGRSVRDTPSTIDYSAPAVDNRIVRLIVRDPWEKTGLEPPLPDRRWHARHHRFSGETTIRYLAYNGTEVDDPITATRGSVRIDLSGRKRYEVQFPLAPTGHDLLKGLFIWIDPPGSAALLDPEDPDLLARGRIYVPREHMTRTFGVNNAGLEFEIGVVESVAQYMAAEMRRNARHPVVAHCRRLNEEANALYEQRLRNVVHGVEEHHLDALDLATAKPFNTESLQHRVVGWEVRREYHADYIESLFRKVGAHGEALDFRRYLALKREAFHVYGGKVRPEPFTTWLERNVQRPLFDLIYGDGDWDHKPKVDAA